MQQQYLNPISNTNERIIITVNGPERISSNTNRSTQLEERSSAQKRRDEQKYDLQYFRDLCEQLNKENLMLKSYQIENNELKQRQLLMDVELSSAQQELLKLRNQLGGFPQQDKQNQKLQQEIIQLQQQISELKNQKQSLESELRLFKENRLTQTIEIPDLAASEYQKKIKEMEEDIQILIEDYNNNQDKLERALNDQKYQFKIEIEQLKGQIQHYQAEITGQQQRYNKLESLKNEMAIKLQSLEKENSQLIYQNQQNLQQQNQQQNQQQQITQIEYQYREQINKLQNQIQYLNNQINLLNLSEEKYLNEQNDFKKKIDQLQNQLQSEKKSQCSKHLKEIQSLKKELEQKEESFKQNNSSIERREEKLELQIQEYIEEINNLKNQLEQQDNQHVKQMRELEIRCQQEIKNMSDKQLILQNEINNKPQTFEESRIRFQTQLDVTNIEALNEKYKKDLRQQEQLIKEQEIQTKLWQEKFYEEQNQNEDLRYKHQELRNLVSQYLGYKTQNEINAKKILELENLVVEQQNIIHSQYQKEQQLKDTIQIYIQKLEDYQFNQTESYEQSIQKLQFEIDQLHIKIKELEASLNLKSTECFDLQTQIEIEKLKYSEREMQFAKQQKEDKKKLTQLEFQQNEIYGEKIRALNIQIEQMQFRIQDYEINLNQKSTECFELQTQVEIERLKFSEREMQISKQQKDEQKRIQQLELQVENFQRDYQILSQKKNEVIKEIVEVQNSYDKERISQLEINLQNLQQEYLIVNSQYIQLQNQYSQLIQQVEQREGNEEDKIRIQMLENQLSQLKQEYFELNNLKQQVLKEVVIENIEVPQQSDQLLIKQLRSELQQLKDEYMILNKQKQTVVVEVLSEVDKNRIKELEFQLEKLRKDYDEVNKLKSSRFLKETVEVSSKSDQIKIKQLERQLQQAKDEHYQLQIQLQESKFDLKQSDSYNTQIQQLQQEILVYKEENKSLTREISQLKETQKNQSSQDKLRIQQLEQKISTLELANIEIKNIQQQVKIVKEVQEVSKDEDIFKIQQLELQVQLKLDDIQYLEKQLSIQKKNVEELISANEKMKYENTKMRGQMYELQASADELRFKIKENERLQEEIKSYQLTISQNQQNLAQVSENQNTINDLQLKLSNSENACKKLKNEIEILKKDFDLKQKTLEKTYEQSLQQYQQEMQIKIAQCEQENIILKNTSQQIVYQNEEMQREIIRLSEILKQKHEECQKLNEYQLSLQNDIQIKQQQLEQFQIILAESQKSQKDNQNLQNQMQSLIEHSTKLEKVLKQFEEEKKIENKQLHEDFNQKIMEFQGMIYQKDSELQQLSVHLNNQQKLLEQQYLSNEYNSSRTQYEDNQRFIIDLQNQISIIKQELSRQISLKDEYQYKNQELMRRLNDYEQNSNRQTIHDYQLTERQDKSVKNLDDSQFKQMNIQRIRDTTSMYNPKPNNFNPLNSSLIKQKVFHQQKKSQLL